ncbi:hypothetical protein K525DRAFT_199544 [Schizophyllum commune Loenen D]|nr:hypothetical protein K525DRAFT_199544 [Schizophyllum commune Loenen D]
MQLTAYILTAILALLTLAAPMVDASPVALRAKVGEPNPPLARIWTAGNTRDEDESEIFKLKRDEDETDIFRRCSSEVRGCSLWMTMFLIT